MNQENGFRDSVPTFDHDNAPADPNAYGVLEDPEDRIARLRASRSKAKRAASSANLERIKNALKSYNFDDVDPAFLKKVIRPIRDFKGMLSDGTYDYLTKNWEITHVADILKAGERNGALTLRHYKGYNYRDYVGTYPCSTDDSYSSYIDKGKINREINQHILLPLGLCLGMKVPQLWPDHAPGWKLYREVKRNFIKKASVVVERWEREQANAEQKGAAANSNRAARMERRRIRLESGPLTRALAFAHRNKNTLGF